MVIGESDQSISQFLSLIYFLLDNSIQLKLYSFNVWDWDTTSLYI